MNTPPPRTQCPLQGRNEGLEDHAAFMYARAGGWVFTLRLTNQLTVIESETTSRHYTLLHPHLFQFPIIRNNNMANART